MVVVEALLSSLFEVVLDKLVATPLLDYARRLKVDIAVLEEWRKTLLHLQAVLHDAERRQTRDESVKRWLDDLQALAYDIEDVLDEFDADAQEPPPTSTSKVRKLIPSFNPSRGATFNKKIKIISQELDAIVKRKSDLHLAVEESRVGGGVSLLADQRLTTSFLLNQVYGRDGDLEKILELLLSNQAATGDQIQVLPIVGMGGVGKTTLAQKIYNHEGVKNHFAPLIWVCVSDRFDLVEITKAILDDSSDNFATLQSLQQRLQAKLNGKRFFLVLDDIWNEDAESWRKLKAPFNSGAPGSVVLVTTRHENVADKMRTTPNTHHLHKLSHEDCWSVFEHLAFDNMISLDTRRNLEPIGRKIVKKCDGLPLAVTTLAGLLRCQQDEKTWMDMLNNEIWDLSTEESKILPALYLSYHCLPTKLKQCFAYCSIFPKVYRFRKDELISLWAAHGLLGRLKRGETVEDAGKKYFQNLLSRSLFQQYPHYSSLFVIHDLIHDLAQFVSGEFCLRLEVGKHNHVSSFTRHVSFFQQRYEISKNFDQLKGNDKLRTFLPLTMHMSSYLANKVLYDLLPKFKCLRYLSLRYYVVTCLPDSFGDLKHLRYLNLSHTKIQKLPKSIGKLVNLRWLILSSCDRLIQLPSEIGKLVHLHHLDIFGTKLEYMPLEINRLKDLQILTTFVVGKHGGAKITGLRDLSHLQGALSVRNLQNVVNAKEASEANLKEKEGLDELRFVWDPDASDTDSTNQTRVLENLKPHDKLRRLSIQSYQGTECPKWLGNPSFNSLVSLQLRDCRHCHSLPSLGQLRCLEFLRFENMMEWEEWGCGGVEFPHLKELYIEKCPKLKGDIPERLPVLTRLEISGCRDIMLSSVCRLISLTCLKVGNVRKIPVELCQLQSLVELYVKNCPELEEIPPILNNLSTLKCLKIIDCERLSSLPETGLPPKLETLYIESCANLESLPETGLPPKLKTLDIKLCANLESLPEGMVTNNDLLLKLTICECKKVELTLPEEMMPSSFASLTILDIFEACDSLTSFPLAFFPNLKHLSLHNCGNLKCLYIPHGIQHRGLISLNYLDITGCPNLVSFPQGGLPAPNLKNLWIENCRKLESLPPRMHALLTSLQHLRIENCPEIVSFAEGGLPPSLSSFYIKKCDKLMACLKQWRLRTLPSLATLLINGGVKEERMESFPEEEPFLPSTLTWLQIGDFPNLESLDEMGLELLPSLQTLGIFDCEKLESFTKQGLPASLTRLEIDRCPVLKKRCQRDKGKLWPTISHIPCIIVGDPYFEREFANLEVILS